MVRHEVRLLLVELWQLLWVLSVTQRARRIGVRLPAHVLCDEGFQPVLGKEAAEADKGISAESSESWDAGRDVLPEDWAPASWMKTLRWPVCFLLCLRRHAK